MNQFYGTAPGVDFREQVEEATKSKGISNAIGIVGVALKGPLGVTLLSSPQQCVSLFGEPHANNSAIKGALACLKNSREVYFQRVISENAAKGVTWEPAIVEVTDTIGDLTQDPTTGGFAFKLSRTDVMPGSIVIKYAGEDEDTLFDDGHGSISNVGLSKVGTVDYATGEVTLSFVEAPQLSECVFKWTDNSKDPWCVFRTKDFTEVYNGWIVTLEWTNNGTVDEPKYKIHYNLKNKAGHVAESFVCDEDETSDLYLGKIINTYSNYLEVELKGEVTVRPKVVYTIAQGNSGLDATVDDIIGTGNTGMKAFYDPEAVDISTLVVPTWTDKRVWQEGIKIGEYRKDIVFIPSLPIGLTPEKVTDLVRGVGEFTTTGLQYDRTFIPVYWPNGVIKNGTTNKYDVVDIAPYVASVYAYSDSVSNIWTAPAGIKRGVIQGLDGLEYYTTKEERDILYSEEVNVNSVVNVKGSGICVMGVRTSKLYTITDGNTALKYINVRRLCNYIRKVVLQESMHNLFDQNDYYTWNDWKMRIEPYLRTIKESRGIYDFELIMDERTVSQADVDAGRMPGVIRIAPIKPNEYIIINFVVAKDGTTEFSSDAEVVI